MLKAEQVPDEAVEFLHGGGYVVRTRHGTAMTYVITDKGRAALAQGGEQ
jgi:predicted MarR family transcription regulator